VAALGVASFSLYSMYWLYATWKEIKQERADPDMRPFWHMMALLVPIYGLFRFHAHIRTIKEEAESHSGATSLMPGVCVVLWIVTGLAVLPGLTGQVIPWWVNLLATAVTTVPVVWGQAALNGAWRLAPGGGVPHPFRVWHLAALALGLLFWASVIAQESGLLA
jgi:hypothetical protein